MTVNLLAGNLKDTMQLLTRALRAAKGKKVEVGPFNSRMIQGLYVWLRGSEEDVEATIKEMRKRKPEFSVTPYEGRDRKP